LPDRSAAGGSARRAGAATVFVTCAPEAKDCADADIIINPVVGPEIVTGSTRMKAGTATKLVLNTLTTAAMIRLGKVYDNLMVDLRATNAKLRDRAERIAAEPLGEPLVAHAARVPTVRCAVGEVVQADGQQVAVSVVAPVGVEEALGAAGQALPGEAADVAHPQVQPASVRVPRVRAGADHAREARPQDLARPRDAGAVVAVVPVKHNDVLRHVAEDLRVVQDDVGPGVHALAVPQAQAADLLEEPQVHPPQADALGPPLAAAFAQFPRLIAADVEVLGLEQGHELLVQFLDQADGAGVAGAERRAARPAAEARHLAQRAVGGQGQTLLHMSKTRQRPHQPHVVPAAVVLHLQQFLGREGAVAASDGRVPPPREHVLHVELKLVDLPVRQALNQGLQRPGARHFAARAVQVRASPGEVGRIVDAAGGQGAAVRRHEFAQRLSAVVRPGVGRGENLDARRRDRQAVRLAARHGVLAADAEGREAEHAALDLRPHAQPREVLRQLLQRQEVGGARACEHAPRGPAEPAAHRRHLSHGNQEVGRCHAGNPFSRSPRCLA
jgi:hypothetical protein